MYVFKCILALVYAYLFIDVSIDLHVCVYVCNCTRTYLYTHIYILTYLLDCARKASWNPTGVEPIHYKPANIDPGTLSSGTNRKVRLFRIHGTNQTKGCIRGRGPTSKSFSGRDTCVHKHVCKYDSGGMPSCTYVCTRTYAYIQAWVYTQIYWFGCLFIFSYTSIWFVCLFIYRYVYVYTYLLICVSFHLQILLYVCVYSSTDTYMCTHISSFVRLFICNVYVCVSIQLQRICVCVYSSATYICVCLFICNVYVYTYLLICLSIHQLTHIYLRCVYEYVQIHISADSHIYWFVCLFIHTHTCITLVVCAVACMNIYRLTYLLSHVPIILYTHVYRHNILWSSHTCLKAQYPLIFTHMSTGTVSFDLYTHVYRHTCKCDSGGARAIPSSNPAVALLSSSRSRCLYWHSPIWFFFFWNSVLLNCLLLNYLLLNYLLSFELFTFLNLNYLPFFWTVYCRQRGRAVFTRILPSGFYFFLNWILAYILVYFLFWTICCRRRGHAVFTGNLPSGFFFLEIFTRIYTCVFFGGNYLLRSRCLDWHSIIWSFFFWTM